MIERFRFRIGDWKTAPIKEYVQSSDYDAEEARHEETLKHNEGMRNALLATKARLAEAEKLLRSVAIRRLRHQVEIFGAWQKRDVLQAAEIERLRGLLLGWTNDCVCQHDSIRHSHGCGRCADSRTMLGMPNDNDDGLVIAVDQPAQDEAP